MHVEERFNLSLNAQIGKLLSVFAARQHQEVSQVAERLLYQALELQEDRDLSLLADARLASPEGWVSHEDAWR